MASIYKRGGKKNRHGRYIASYFDANGKRVDRSTGTADYDAACQIAGKWETDVALRRAGVIDASQIRFAEHNQRALKEHIAEYITHCEHIGQDRVHVSNKQTQLDKLVAGIDATRLSDLDPNKVERYLASVVKGGSSHRTHNQHRATAVSFMEWCYEQGRIATNPLKIVPTLNEAKDRRRVRRALSEDELSRLVSVSADRRLYYLFAYYTGLRVKAVKAAVWGDVDFDSATIRVRVGNAKGKREDTFYNLHSRLMEELHAAGPAGAVDPIFPAVPTVRTFHRDCERAGIERYDSEGRQLDRHALRTTLGTHLARAGVLPQHAMKVLGHTDVRITMKHYTDLRLSDTAKSVSSLPTIQTKKPVTPEAATMRATGTDDTPVGGQTHGPTWIQQKSQQLCGFESHIESLNGTDMNAVRATDVGKSMLMSPSNDKGLDIASQPVSSNVLLISASGRNIEKSRAIGAVG